MAAASMAQGAEWRVPVTAEREVYLGGDGKDIPEVMRWLGDTAEHTFRERSASPAAFAFGKPQESEEPTQFFFNWKVKVDRGIPEYLRDLDQLFDDNDEVIQNSDGDDVYAELWQRHTRVTITFYNKGDAHFAGAREVAQAFKTRKFKLSFRLTNRDSVEPSDYNEGVDDKDLERDLYGAVLAPSMAFEQQDENGGFLPAGSAKFATRGEAAPRQVITAEHRYRAFLEFIKAGALPEIARTHLVPEAFKDAYRFDALDFTSFGWEDLRVKPSRFIVYQPSGEKGAEASGGLFTMWSILYRKPRKTRRRSLTPPTQPGEEKRGKTESPFRVGAKCSFCNRRKAVAVCDGCGDAKYCGEQCQKIAWHFDGHHKTCFPKK